ncbi:MAG: excisionase family DNA-binding protein [bacterium]|nr:excisionase family DNA-binding protein [bacterium]
MDSELLKEIRDLLKTLVEQQVTDRVEWLSPEGAAAYLGMSESKLYKLVAENGIPHHRPPNTRLIRFDRAEVDEWVRGDSPAPKPQVNIDELIRSL